MLMVQASLPGALLVPAATAGAAADMAAGAAADATAQQAGQAGGGSLAAARGGFATGIELRGGTDAAMAPPYGYSEHVLLPTLRRHLGLRLDMQCAKHGGFPKVTGSTCVCLGLAFRGLGRGADCSVTNCCVSCPSKLKSRCPYSQGVNGAQDKG